MVWSERGPVGMVSFIDLRLDNGKLRPPVGYLLL